MSLSNLLFSLTGRIPRSTYWYFQLAFLGVAFIALTIDGVISMTLGTNDYGDPNYMSCLSFLVALAGILPAWAVSVKRAHDRDHSGWFLLVSLIPFVGGLWLFIELGFLKGTVGPNQYGPDPIARTAAVITSPQS